MKIKHAYTGSFDPFTKGHQSVIELFLSKDPDVNLEIIIGKNPDKKDHLLEEVERVFLIRKGVSKKYLHRIKISIVEGIIADYLYEQDIPYFIRGIRNVQDYHEEINLASLNSQLYGSPMTLLIPQVKSDLSTVSSSNLNAYRYWNTPGTLCQCLYQGNCKNEVG